MSVPGSFRPSPTWAQLGEPPVALGLVARLIVGSFLTGTVVLCMYSSTSDSMVCSANAQRSAFGNLEVEDELIDDRRLLDRRDEALLHVRQLRHRRDAPLRHGWTIAAA